MPIKQHCLRSIFTAKAVLLYRINRIKSSTAFGQFLQQKQCCFWSIFGTKALLDEIFEIFEIFQLALLLFNFYSKSSAAFGRFLEQKQHCFCSIFEPKVVAVFAVLNQSINQSINESLSLVSVVQSGHVIPFFASTEPKEFN